MSALDQKGDDTSQVVTKAQFKSVGPGAPGKEIPVNFNPETLEYTVTNNIKEEGNSTENKQQVSKSSGKLSMELVFDTTLTGEDVRVQTEKLQALMKPSEEGGKKIAPIVEFSWGTYRFKGIFTSYKETLNYFSTTGVPLRASISITMTQQDGLFAETAKGDTVKVNDSPTFEPPGNANDEDNTTKGPATGNPEVDRGLAEDNDEENPRFFSGKELSVPSGPNLLPPSAFASAGISIGGSAGFGLGIDIGFSAGVSAGVGIGLGIEAGIDVGLSAGFDVDIGVSVGFEATVNVSASVNSSASASVRGSAGIGGAAGASAAPAIGGAASGTGSVSAAANAAIGAGAGSASAFAGFGSGEFSRGPSTAAGQPPGAAGRRGDPLDGLVPGPTFGGNASAGVPAALGAFDGLRPVGPRRRRPLMMSKLWAQRPERDLRTDASASFEIGGQAMDRSPNGLGADVGSRATLAERIAFDDPIGEG